MEPSAALDLSGYAALICSSRVSRDLATRHDAPMSASYGRVGVHTSSARRLVRVRDRAGQHAVVGRVQRPRRHVNVVQPEHFGELDDAAFVLADGAAEGGDFVARNPQLTA